MVHREASWLVSSPVTKHRPQIKEFCGTWRFPFDLFLVVESEVLRVQYELMPSGHECLRHWPAIYVLSLLVFYATHFRAYSDEKIFHYIFAVALLVGAIAYFSWAPRPPKHIFDPEHLASPTRPVIIALVLISGVSWATIFFNITLSWVWIVSYLVSAFTVSKYKWGFFAFGTVAYLILAYNTLAGGLTSSRRVGISRDYTLLAGWTNLLWLLWPITFAVSDGSNVIGVTPSAVWFGILDVLLTPVIAFAIFSLSRKWDYNRLNLAFTRYGRVHTDGHYPEKHTAAPASSDTAPSGGVV
ncbi:uncharacterized protein BCR38DRAFT_457890 [Pseudomassariella vexata]|uniref:Uncharacterized protein n=1 Tax=Pseudomassariella vexata TaxID=1141098 RepID=A0A1Y2DXY1_9PEZI|nr:uncharacterized protein BCR38DRAFT_457890 [Pseudomassariella vexata]ORY64103.1 hypothetical protein BCR38DRAFT_457890 [Pseudomassariella vexata]